MELIYDISEYLGVPNEHVNIDKVHLNNVWFSTAAGAKFTCKTIRGGKRLKKNSIRLDID